MDVLTCGHAAFVGRSRLCTHLVEAIAADRDLEWVRALSGVRLDGDVICVACADLPTEDRPLIVACEACVSAIEDDTWSFQGYRGRPGIQERIRPLNPQLKRSPLPSGLLDLQPIAGETSSAWIALTAAGDIVRIDLDDPVVIPLASIPATVAPEPIPRLVLPKGVKMTREERRRWHDDQTARRAPRRLVVSSDGRFVAVVATRGSRGVVVDLRSGSLTMRLDRGDYHVGHYDFACAFAAIDGRTLLVHATDWNRVDISDPASGELLTPRGPTRYSPGEERPAHYLDYFHGAITVAPGDGWVLDDGWVWHPIGGVRTWDLRRWATDYPWESEDGPTARVLCWRSYYWGHPMCWISGSTVAISGLGFDDEHIIAGARVFDVETGLELCTFAGPDGQFFSDGAQLFTAGPQGLNVWDPLTGDHTGRVAGFAPDRHHAGARELVEIRGNEAVRWVIN